MQTFSPERAPSDPKELPDWLNRQMLGIQRAANQGSDALPLRVLSVAPARPQGGWLYNADGVKWNPGSGAGIYRYNATTAAYVAVGGSTTSGGGAVSSGSQTLTSASSKAQKLVFTGPGQFVKLPDATTCTKDVNLFGLYNASQYGGSIMDSTGVIRGFIRPWTRVSVDLADNSTAAGGWGLGGADLYGITAIIRSTLQNGNASPKHFAVALDANRTLVIWSGSLVQAAIWDSSTQTVGTPVTVRSGVTQWCWSAILSAANQVLVISDSGTARQAVTLSCSGSTVAVNSGVLASAVLGGVPNCHGELIAVGSGFVLSYSRATTTQAAVAVTISTNTPSFGAEVTLSTTGMPSTAQPYYNPHPYAVSSSVVLFIGQATSTSALFATPYTLSGNTLTVGTTAAIGAASAVFGFRTMVMGTRWIVMWLNSSTTVSASLISVSSTTATVSTVASVLSSLVSVNVENFDSALVGARVLVVAGATGFMKANLLTDTAGTLSAGTILTAANDSGIAKFAILGVNGTNANVLVSPQNGTPGVSSRGDLFILDCSGANVGTTPLGDTIAPGCAVAPASQPYNALRHPGNLRCGAGWTAHVSSLDPMFGYPLLVGVSEVMALPTRLPYVGQNNALNNFTSCSSGVISDYVTWLDCSDGSGNATVSTMVRIEGARP